MSNVIDRQAVIDALDEIRHVLDKKEKELTILPSAEPEIIRCKDCRNYASYWGRCKHWERISTESVLVAENDFCSQAERKLMEQI
jgi:hypothetical protein